MKTQIIENDERQGIPSASRLLRLKLCPGSYRAESQWSDSQPSESNLDAERGRRIHATAKLIAMGEDISPLYPETPPGEIEEAWRLYGIYKKIEKQVSENGDKQQSIIEERFWLLDDDGIKVLSGQIDIGGIFFKADEKRWEALICDYKTGWGDVDCADVNLQMRAYAVLLKASRPELERITVAIIAPSHGVPTLACYGGNELKQAKYEILETLREATLHDVPRIAGVKQCKYCPAKSRCPEYQKEFLAPVPIIKSFSLDANDWDVETKARFCERLPEMTKWLEEQKKKVEKSVEAGEVPDWRIGEGKRIQKLNDPQAAYGRLSNNLTADAFTEACTISLPKLRKIYARRYKLTDIEAKYHLAKKLAGLIEETTTKGQLEKIK